MYRPRVLSLKSPSEITRELSKIGVDPRGVEKLLPKGIVRVIRVEKLPSPAAHILKQQVYLNEQGQVILIHVARVPLFLPYTFIIFIFTFKIAKCYFFYP